MKTLCCAGAICLLALAALLPAKRVFAAQNPPTLADMASPLGDMEASLHLNRVDQAALEKIGPDFKRTYTLQSLLRKVTLLYKAPGKLRMEGRNAILGEAVIILNGPTRFWRVPRMPQKVEDLKNDPGKRQSLLEYGGLVTPDILTFMQGKWLRTEPLDGQEAHVFDLTYKGQTGGQHFRVWVDSQTHVTRKREWYDGTNRLRATFLYQQSREITPGVWLPTQIEVRAGDGTLAAQTSIDDVRINQGLNDNLFDFPH